MRLFRYLCVQSGILEPNFVGEVCRRLLQVLLAACALGAWPAALAAEPDLSYLLDALRQTPEGEWVQVNQNSFSSVWTPDYLRPLYGTPKKIIEAWSSFAWDSNRGDLISYGGGHANYSGNDVYRWRGSTGLWERASLPSEITNQDVTVDGADHAPVSAHTYDNNVFLANIDRFLTFGGARYKNSGPYIRLGDGTFRRTGPYAFDPNRADANKVGGLTGSHVQREGAFPDIVGGEMWQNRDIYANLGVNELDPSGFVEATTAVTEEDGNDVVYVTGARGSSQQHLYKYTVRVADDPTQDSWQRVGTYSSSFSGQGAGTYDSNLNIFVRTAGNQFVFWDLSTPGGINHRVVREVVRGCGELDSSFGMDYNSTGDQYLLWRGDGRVWAMYSPGVVSTSGWVIEQLPAPMLPAPSGDHGGRGVLGKWKYIAQLDVFIGLVDPVDGNVWLYKPIGWLDPGDSGDTDVPPLEITSSTLQGGIAGLPYSANLTASGGSGRRTWSADDGTLPAGLTLSSSGVLAGTPLDAGSYLFAVAVEDSIGQTASRLVSLEVAEPPPPPGPNVPLDFSAVVLDGFADQDVSGGFDVLDGGTTIGLWRNTWKRLYFPYNVTPNTVLEFEFQAGVRGEIHGIAFEEDDYLSQDRIFRLYGTQQYGISDYANYPGNGWVQYRIRVGDYYTGAMRYLLLVTDDDAHQSAESYFRNIRVLEEAPNFAPSVAISVAPTPDGESFELFGQASDTEDGNLDASIFWTSSLDGELGSGAALTVTLSTGVHTVTATVTDSRGLSSNATVSVRVGDVPGTNFLDFTAVSLESYDVQDVSGTATHEDAGSTLLMTGNTWKRVEVPYEIGLDTYLEFDFKAGIRGEIHGIGLDEENVLSADRIFRLAGSQVWGIASYANYTGSDWVSYRIPVGRYYTGHIQNLVFVMDDDANSAGVSRFRNVRIVEGEPPPLPPSIDFSALAISSFSNQDVVGTVSIEDGGTKIRLNGNTWKRVAMPITITRATVLEFEFQAGERGEIHGIGVTNNNQLDPSLVFGLYGTQFWGIRDFADYSGTAWKTYRIEIGRYFTGTFTHLVLTMDDDANASGSTAFRNVRIY